MQNSRERLMSYQPLWTNWYFDDYISKGAFSEVYRFRQRGFDITCAVKMISVNIFNISGMGREQKLNAISTRRVLAENEISIMYQLNDCPYIVHCKNHDIRDIKDENGGLIGFDVLIQMDCYSCLAQQLAGSDEALSVKEVIKLAKQVGGALKAAHDINVIHRDIKPENIFLDAYGNYLLGDFGVSKQMQSQVYSTKAGTEPYIAPEVYRGEQYTASADVYSLGLVLYTLLNNNYFPFTNANSSMNDIDNAITRRLSGEQLPEPANGSPELKRLVLHCCQADPARRCSSIEEMLRELARLSGEALPVVIPKTPTSITPASPNRQRSDTRTRVPAVRDHTTQVNNINAVQPVVQKNQFPIKKLLIALSAALLVIIAAIVVIFVMADGDSSDRGSTGRGKKVEVYDIEFAGETYSSDIKKLAVSGEELSDEELSKLAEFTQLRSLSLTECGIEDISAIGEIETLEELVLNSNMISDISPLAGLEDLELLFLVGNSITDISALSGLTELEELYLSSNKITDISALKGLKSLKSLSLISNKITDVSALSGLKALTKLELSYNDISDASPLYGMTGLKTLKMIGTDISDEDRQKLKEKLSDCTVQY
ncbi:MAG: hypothetical protein E7478_01910 [Ruminococcaceae bacterium]|nr:hypothetical protein [Oscillospiraceae bacterium]